MITFVRTAVAMPGRIQDLVGFAKEIAAIAEKATGRKLAVAGAVGSVAAQVAWIGSYDNLGQFEEFSAKLTGDPAYRSAAQKAATLMVPGSLTDHIWRHV